jgi:predicted nucleic acid-binding protein
VTLLTLDASVIYKWYLDPSAEADVEAAQAIAIALRAGQIAVVQPPHWLAEVATVTARMLPRDAATIVDELAKLNLETMAGTALYQRAVRLAIDTGAHVFDSLYHAVALENPERTFITADQRYFKAARRFGQIAMLDNRNDLTKLL